MTCLFCPQGWCKLQGVLDPALLCLVLHELFTMFILQLRTFGSWKLVRLGIVWWILCTCPGGKTFVCFGHVCRRSTWEYGRARCECCVVGNAFGTMHKAFALLQPCLWCPDWWPDRLPCPLATVTPQEGQSVGCNHQQMSPHPEKNAGPENASTVHSWWLVIGASFYQACYLLKEREKCWNAKAVP